MTRLMRYSSLVPAITKLNDSAPGHRAQMATLAFRDSQLEPKFEKDSKLWTITEQRLLLT